MAALTQHLKDPDTDIQTWVQGGTPLGIECDIKERGVFPATDTSYESGVAEYTTMKTDADNYGSYSDYQKEAEDLLREELNQGRILWDRDYHSLCKRAGGTVTLSKIGVVAKLKQEQLKVRLVHDLRTSGENDAVKLNERVVLPRLMDAVNDGLELAHGQHDHTEYEHLGIDFSDAFKQLPLDPAEWRHVGGAALGGYFVYVVLLFGVRSGPLLWGRVAAWLMRLTSLVFHGKPLRVECYVDDPLLTAAGPRGARRLLLAQTLLLWMALGFKLAWLKGSLGQSVDWIGARIHPWVEAGKWLGLVVTIAEKRCQELKELCTSLSRQRLIKKRQLSSLAGLASWMGGLMPQLVPFCRMLWAALTARPDQPAIHAKQVALPLKWLRAFADDNMNVIKRRCRKPPPYFNLLSFDGSPTGGGATLTLAATSRESQPTYIFATQWNDADERRARATIGDPASQHLWEAYALLEAIRAWHPVWSCTSANLVLRGDAKGVLQSALKLRGREPNLNRLMCELALYLAPHGMALDACHVWSEDNALCDTLSRLAGTSVLPPHVKHLQMTPRSSKPYRFI